MTTVAEVMTRGTRTVGARQTIQQAAKMMEELNVGSLPVCDGDTLVGVVTDRDIAVRAVSAGLSPNTTVEDISSGPLEWCFENDDLEKAREKMERLQIRRVPVVDEQKRIVGVLALGDLAINSDGGVGSTLAAISTPSVPDR